MKTLKIISERVMRGGYVLRVELVRTPFSDHKPYECTIACTPHGHYIGTPRDARHLCVKLGIAPEPRTPASTVCSVGFSRKDGKWYGWSHRAIRGFTIGSKCRNGMSHYRPLNMGGRGSWTAKTFADARQMACDFAESVS